MRIKYSKMNQQEMADILGVKKRTYGSWERGEAMINLEYAFKCAVILGCSIDEIAGRSTGPTSNSGDADQQLLNECYESMSDEGKKTLLKVASSLEKDAANRVEKDSPKHPENKTAIA